MYERYFMQAELPFNYVLTLELTFILYLFCNPFCCMFHSAFSWMFHSAHFTNTVGDDSPIQDNCKLAGVYPAH